MVKTRGPCSTGEKYFRVEVRFDLYNKVAGLILGRINVVTLCLLEEFEARDSSQ